ncbi:pheromone A receptor-domain-containing protein [Pholiota molesta]|nr:pheromone A receptor-domain-containing protein [Pholiota molesta]
MSVVNSVFSAFSFITLILVLIPFPWHLEAWNTGTCLYMFWTALGLLSYFVNSIIWRNNAINWAPIWCDITTRIVIGISVAIPAASLCINHRLYCIASVHSAMRTRQEKYRAIMVDLAIGVGLPVIAMILAYIPQGHRFNIFEEVGCFPAIYNTPPAYFSYGFMTIIAFRKRHAEFKKTLFANSNLDSNRFIRLMVLAGIEVACCIPLSITTIVLNATRSQVQPWISWEDTHYVVCGLVFFAFFGFADEAQKHYKLAFASVAKHVGYTTNGSTKVGTGMSSTGKFKSFKGTSSNGLKVIEKRDSLDSFSDITSMKESEYDAVELPSTIESPFSTLKTDSVPSSTPTVSYDPPRPSGSFLDMSKHADNADKV